MGTTPNRARAAGSGIPKTWLTCLLTLSRASGLQSEKWGCLDVMTSGSKLCGMIYPRQSDLTCCVTLGKLLPPLGPR